MSALRSTALVLALAALSGCHVDEGSFYATVFPCSAAAPANECGTTKAGKPMVCYPGSQQGGGSDFCTEACNPDGGAVEPGYICAGSGAQLKSCLPDPPAGTPNGCPAGLNCYRTDIGSNQGVCLMMRVCTVDSDCTDSRRPKCVATLLHQVEPLVTTDHLECVQPTCASSGSDCQVGESCSASYFNTGQNIPDLCIPNCLGDGECPPNYACARDPAAPGSPAVCIPGLPGGRCSHEEDCVWGDCLDTGAGFSECIIPSLACTTDLDCAILNAADTTFACGPSGCVGLTAFHGSNCLSDADCQSGEQCFEYSPYGVTNGHGECRVPCAGDLTCAATGGVPHVCLDDGGGGCYPGDFALPCTQSSECLSELACLAVSPDPRTIIDSPSICTITCASDDDCRQNAIIRGGFCEEGVCRLPGQAGVPCDRNAECVSGLCSPGSTSGSGQCS